MFYLGNVLYLSFKAAISVAVSKVSTSAVVYEEINVLCVCHKFCVNLTRIASLLGLISWQDLTRRTSEICLPIHIF